jgi:hypothetical protein
VSVQVVGVWSQKVNGVAQGGALLAHLPATADNTHIAEHVTWGTGPEQQHGLGLAIGTHMKLMRLTSPLTSVSLPARMTPSCRPAQEA